MTPFSNLKLEIEKLEEYDNHHKVVLLNNPETGLKGFIAIHRKNKDIPSFGATRLLHYRDSLDGLRDALRLSRLMSYKSALSGLPCGGAKGVILAPKRLTSENRKRLLLSYAEEVNALNGDFITGTDVGVLQDDLKLMKSVSPFFVGFNGNSTECTALGIYFGMETCCSFLDDGDNLAGKTFAIQGLGKVGAALLALVYPKAGKVYAADIDKSVAEKIKKKFPKVVIVAPSEIHKQKVDIFAPCALSGALNSKTIAELKCRIIAGGANNQLEDDTIGDLLFKLGILYAPDYVVNAGGLIAVFDEYEHKKNNDERIYDKVFAIKERLHDILEKSKKENHAPNYIANEMAEKMFNNF
ncbi:MAG: leucine dehydrogenase [Candidatus Magasanikbacteria bacterium CG10_big_fil_rev_8_21_14_0_10_47_10]|uniref:Leucine dehydrogenase n=1 Tax=Candidatus Magasanikbacteria bacterium CG10_big_fil_rev_8_21_14_0_10_47_10 TaxID=1974652 RepID=A0A2H0TTL5_9BACT|nr:MAG: leucine dehydrogenase [Candidatus Magasanikbacteria bacterium CG10_big_fil_rev_8_21_14_0_10_47_10]